jgi:DNA-directed RNA polymerase beta' subunit
MILQIGKVEFGIYSDDEIKKMAVCKVYQVDNPKLEGNKSGTVYDERMGYVPDSNKPCVTCNETKNCPGHVGYIELSTPILHPMLFKTISIFLSCFCKKCYRLLLTEEQLKLYGFDRLEGEKKFVKILEKIQEMNTCPHEGCETIQPTIIFKVKESAIVQEYKNNKTEKASIVMEVEDIKKIFESVSDEDVKNIGINPTRNHPKNLIISSLIVIPPCSRPYVISNGNVCDDDITYQYIEIIKTNRTLENKELDEQKKQKSIQMLKFRIATLFDNSKRKAKHPTDSRPLKGIKERLSGKHGRFRNNLMGKRVDFSARTVITAEPTLKLNELGVPLDVVRIHTKTERVNTFNIDRLQKLTNEGKVNFIITKSKGRDDKPSNKPRETRINLQYASFRKGTELMYGDVIVKSSDTPHLKVDKKGKVVIPKDAETIVVKNEDTFLEKGDLLVRNGKQIEAKYAEKKNIKLNIGDVVERQLDTGDIVLFNRQPTLHKGSMMALKVVPKPGKSFRFNLAACKSFNSDFDKNLNLKTGLKLLSKTGGLKRVKPPSEI